MKFFTQVHRNQLFSIHCHYDVNRKYRFSIHVMTILIAPPLLGLTNSQNERT
jgi:hypothetical protein